MRQACLLTTNRIEYMSVRSSANISNWHTSVDQCNTIYETGVFTEDGQRWKLSITEIDNNNVDMASATERMIQHFSPHVLIFIGVARGVKTVSSGDVVVAQKVYNYESGKIEGIRRLLPRPTIGQIHPAMKQRAKAEARKNDWLRRIQNKSMPSPKVYICPTASGEAEILSKETEDFQRITADYSDSVAVDNSSYGFLKTASDYPQIKSIVILGISELVGDNNNASSMDNLINQAAIYASAFAFEILVKYKIWHYPQWTYATSAIVSPVLLTTLVYLTRSTGLIESLESNAYDISLSNRPFKEQIDKQIVLVTVSPEDKNKFKSRMIVDSLTDELLLNTLKEIKKYNPALIGLDIIANEEKSPERKKEYDELVDYLKVENTIIKSCERPSPKNPKGFDKPVSVDDKYVGYTNMVVEKDEVIRRQLLAQDPDAETCKTINSFALKISLQYLSEEVDPNKEKTQVLFHKNKDKKIDILTSSKPGFYQSSENERRLFGYNILVNYRNGHKVFDEIPLSELLLLTEPLSLHKKIKNRIVLIGYSYEDLWQTPYLKAPNTSRTPGIFLHAHMVSQMVNYVKGERSMIQPINPFHEVIWTLLFAGISACNIYICIKVRHGQVYWKEVFMLTFVYSGISTLLYAMILNHPFAPFPLFLMPWIPTLFVTAFTPIIVVAMPIPIYRMKTKITKLSSRSI